MTLAVLFWVIMIVSLLFGVWSGYRTEQPFPLRTCGAILFILLAILGWAVFGSPVK